MCYSTFSLAILVVVLTIGGPAVAQSPLTEVWAQRHGVDSGAFTVTGAHSRNGRTSVVGTDLFGGASPDPYTVQFAADGSVSWATRTFVPGDARALAVTVDDGGDTYVVGTRVLDWNADLFVLRYDVNGDLLWSTIYDESTGGGVDRDEWAEVIVVGPDGRVYALAESEDTDGDYLVVALDTGGEVLWTDRYDGSGGEDDTPVAIAVDDEGRVFVTGHSDVTGGWYESATVAYAPDGTRRWTHRYAGPSENPRTSLGGTLSPDGEGGVFLAGFAFSQEVHELLVMHYEPDGEPGWVQTYPGPTQLNTSARMLKRSPEGSLVVAGVAQTSGIDYDLLLFGYNTDGTLLWEARHADPPFNVGELEDAAVGPDGKVYVAGWGAGEADGTDFVVVRYGPTGEYETHATSGWSGPGPSPCNEFPRRGSLDASGDVYVAGRSICGKNGEDAGAYAVRFTGVSTPAEPAPSVSEAALRTHPNPFQSTASVSLTAPTTGPAIVELFDLLGRRVATLYEGVVTSGVETSIRLSGGDLPSGFYLVRASGKDWSLNESVVRVE